MHRLGMHYLRAVGRPRGVAMLAAVAIGGVLTSAGACQQDWDGPLPPPEDVGAAPFPDGAVVGGLDAVYATLTDTTRLREGGRDVVRQCYWLLRLRPDGVADTSTACTEDGDISGPAGAADTWDRRGAVGDYAHGDGVLAVRLVDWDFIVEELELTQWALEYCADGWYGRNSSGERVVTARLVIGEPPADAPPCD